jgi:hypothetical protein
VGVVKAGGYANIATHETFCAKLDCVISNVYDQSPQKNHLGARHKVVNASEHKITIGPTNTPVYGMWFDPGYGYHVDNTTGIATGNDEESIYAVMSGTHISESRPVPLVHSVRANALTHPLSFFSANHRRRLLLRL